MSDLKITEKFSSFTLAKLPVSKTCQTDVFTAVSPRENNNLPHNACEASASCTGGALHICRRQMLHTFVCLARRGMQDTKCLIRSTFTLIELLVVTSQHCRDFFRGFICTDQYGCVRKHTESAAHKNTSHHTCKASASCLPQANASCSNFAPGRIY